MVEDQEIVLEFLDVSEEVLEKVVTDVMELKNNLDDEILNRVFRAFRAVTGSARMLGFDRLGELSHKAEEVFSLMRGRNPDGHEATADLLFFTVATMRLILYDIRKGGDDGRDTEATMNLLDDTMALAKEAEPDFPARNVIIQAARAAKRPLKIMIVDDDFISRAILDKFLSKYGKCDTVKDGMEAIDAFTESYQSKPPQPYDLICMDIMMPILDGLQASRKIREIERGKGVEGTILETIIVITSAVEDPATIIRSCYEFGANYYFLKPLDFNQMKRQMNKFRLII